MNAIHPASPPRAMRDTLLLAVYEAMRADPEIFFVSADFGSPVLDKIRADCPDRFINVGIAEQNLINISAGLALEGFRFLPMPSPLSSPCAVSSRYASAWPCFPRSGR